MLHGAGIPTKLGHLWSKLMYNASDNKMIESENKENQVCDNVGKA